MRRFAFTVLAVVAWLLLCAGAASASQGVHTWTFSADPSFAAPPQPFMICTALFNQTMPALSGDIVVWSDARDAEASGSDIHLYDFSAGQERALCTAPHDQLRVAVSGTKVVWEDRRSGSSDIYMYDLTSGQERVICDAPGNQQFPSISGNRIVWMDARSAASTGQDIYEYDLVTGTESPVCTAPGDQTKPMVSGDRVVWRDARNSASTGQDIYAYDWATQTESPVCTASGDQRDPVVDGDIILWEDLRDQAVSQQDIYMKVLPAGEEKAIVTAPGNQGAISIWGDKVVYEDQRNMASTGSDVSMYDLATGVETVVSAAPGNQAAPRICAGTIVWQDSRNSSATGVDIYGAYVDVTPPETTVGGVPSGWVNHDVAATFTAVDPAGDRSGLAYTEYSVDGGSTWAKGGSVTISADGETTLKYRSADRAGNVEADRTAMVRIDTGIPSTTAKKVTVKSRTTATFKFAVKDPMPSCGSATATIKITRAGGKPVKILRVGAVRTDVPLTYKWKATVPKGTYKYRVLATDAAGNVARSIGSVALVVK
jgi:beta propeller repeat protein